MTDQTLDEGLMKRETPEYADFGSRLLAFLIDFVIFTFIGYLIWGSEVVNTTNGFHVQFNNEKTIVPFGYFLLCWGFLSTTPGKMALGLRIVDKEGKKINFIAALIRSVGYIILIIGCWFILGNDKKQALHDKWANTFVVKGRK